MTCAWTSSRAADGVSDPSGRGMNWFLSGVTGCCGTSGRRGDFQTDRLPYQLLERLEVAIRGPELQLRVRRCMEEHEEKFPALPTWLG